MTNDLRLFLLKDFLEKEGLKDDAEKILKLAAEGRPEDDVGIQDVLWNIPTSYWIKRPEVVEKVSLFTKIIGAILSVTGAGTAAGVGTIKASGALDLTAAIGRFNNDEYFMGLINVLSAIISVPAGAMKKFVTLMLSDDIINVYAHAIRPLGGTYDQAALAAYRAAEGLAASIPVALDFLINSLESLADTDPLAGLGKDLGESNVRRMNKEVNKNLELLRAQRDKVTTLEAARSESS